MPQHAAFGPARILPVEDSQSQEPDYTIDSQEPDVDMAPEGWFANLIQNLGSVLPEAPTP